MNLLTSTFLFILGTSIGSFLSVVVYRLHSNKKGIFLSRSICPHCNKQLKWNHLIPVFSWLFLKGKCAYCDKKISPKYLTFELITGFIFVITFLNFNFIQTIPASTDISILSYGIDWLIMEQLVFYLVMFTFLLGIFFYDFLYQEIPDSLSLTAVAIAIAGTLVLGTPTVFEMLIGGSALFLFFAAQFYLSGGKWIGGGDIRLGLLIGVLLGIKLGLLALMISYILGATISLILIATKKATKKSKIAFGPFLVSSTIIVVFYGNEILTWYFGLLTS